MNKTYKINNYNIVVFFLLFSFVFPEGILNMLGVSAKFISLAQVISIVVILFMYFRTKAKPSFIMIMLIITYLTIFISAYLHPSMHANMYDFIGGFGMCIMFDYWLQKRPKEFLGTLRVVLWFLIIINFFSILFFPEGMYRTELYEANWILGYKNSHGNFIFMFCCLEAILSYKQDRKIGIQTYLKMIFCCISLFACDAMTHFIMLCFFVILMVLFVRKSEKKIVQNMLRVCSLTNIIVVTSIITLFVVVFQNNNMLSEYLDAFLKMFNRDSGFTGRLYVWSAAMYFFVKSPIIGYGGIESSLFVRVSGIAGGTHAHNYILNILLMGGVVCLIEHIMLYGYTIRKIHKNLNFYSYSVSIMLGIYFIVGITSINFTFTFFNCLFILASYLCELQWEKKHDFL